MTVINTRLQSGVNAVRAQLLPPAIGLGCSRLGSTLSGCGGPEAVRLLRHALDAGVTLFDTANIYGQGESERLLGEALRGQRSKVTLVTKAGQRFTALQRAATLVKAPLRRLAQVVPSLRRNIASRRAGALPRDYSAAHLRQSIESSLRRLDTDRIDLFLLHSPSAEAIAQGEAFAMLNGLRAAGTLGGWGISVDDEAAARAALAVPDVAGLQLPLSVAAALRPELSRAAERGVALFMRELFASGPRDAATRQAAVEAALAYPGATALVGTTSIPHLDEALRFGRAPGRR
jgi:aryl-alcohol dehydrogenase-like predicted oxidoreductase